MTTEPHAPVGAPDAPKPKQKPHAAQKAEMEQQIAALKDQLLRTAAEMENTRKRAEKQREESHKFAVAGFAQDLMEVMDNLYRATATMDGTELPPALAPLVDGVNMTLKEMTRIFQKHGMHRFMPTVGEAFDHNLHQAVAHVEHAEHASGIIVDVMQAGYCLHDRLLRPAMVAVAK